MLNSNVPDDCQSITDTRLPWNEPEQEVYVCWSCGEEVNEDKLIEVKTRDHGEQFIAPCCFNDYIKDEI